ncbi:MAG TPA: hypothetical protein VEN78_33050, partial [Bradyrhizobium sp.]|nr:hypothetical protein [Bradyrhizobium sp.]
RVPALLPIIDQIIKNPNSSVIAVAVLEVFRPGTVTPSGVLRCGSKQTRRDAENARKISLLRAWHSPCSLLGEVVAQAP